MSDSLIASQVGARVLADGGNAIDAAIATAFALAVTFPSAGNLGGGGFMLVRMSDGRTYALDYREVAPQRATRDMYVDEDGSLRPGASTDGHLAAGVPGTVAGMEEAHRRWSTRSWESLVAPAVELANEGFAMTIPLSRGLRNQASRFARNAEAWRVFNREGNYYQPGELFRQPDLGRVLERIRDRGAKGFYEGETARLLEEDMAAHGGIMTAADLAAYRPVVREPLRGTYRGYEVITMPPPSSGGIAVLQMLGALERDDLASLGFGTPATLHLMVEVMKRAFADRAAHLGDPDHAAIPVRAMLTPERIAAIRASIEPGRATPAREILAGDYSSEGEHTTHFSVMDQFGNVVANTYTINSSYGAAVVPKGLGFLLNNEMDDFAAQVGRPNAYGLIQGEANAIVPGKRPLSSMTPTILLRNGRPVLVLGSPGGPTIINTVFQTIVNVVDHGMTIDRAVAAFRVHHQWLPDEIRSEPSGPSEEVRSALEAMGHVFRANRANMGSCHAIFVEPTGVRVAGVDPRLGDSGAVGH